MPMPHYVYILRLPNDQLYVGSTGDLTRRLGEHKRGSGSQTTSQRGFEELVYSETLATKPEAETRERQIKGWTRAKKEALIRGDAATLHELSKRHNQR